jgi:hypothetical protein
MHDRLRSSRGYNQVRISEIVSTMASEDVQDVILQGSLQNGFKKTILCPETFRLLPSLMSSSAPSFGHESRKYGSIELESRIILGVQMPKNGSRGYNLMRWVFPPRGWP